MYSIVRNALIYSFLNTYIPGTMLDTVIYRGELNIENAPHHTLVDSCCFPILSKIHYIVM